MIRLTRRGLLKALASGTAWVTVSGCSGVYQTLAGPVPAPPTALPQAPGAFRLLNRLTYGPRHTDLAYLQQIGAQAWIEEQLAPQSLDDSACELRLRPLDSLELDAASLFDLYGDQLFDDQDTLSAPAELRQATFIRQVYSRRQLYEQMVSFWTDHFNISVEKGACFYLKTVDDREVIRAHALGKFRDILWASAHSPAMLVYLDNQANEKSHPNENYARELLELHTLGVDGGYTQADVMALARCLTGWTVKDHFWKGQFTFRSEMHDSGVKRVLGIEIPPGGQQEAESVLEKLASHESTARFLVKKLSQRFLGTDGTPSLMQAAVQAFHQTDGDIGAVLRVLLLDGLAQIEPTPRYKRPVQFVASALRQLQAQTDGESEIQGFLLRMGQLPFTWPTPDGFPDQDEAWFGNLLPRWQFAQALASNQLPGAQVDLPSLLAQASTPAAVLDRLSRLLLGGPLPGPVSSALLQRLSELGGEPDPSLVAASLLAAPAFQWR